MALTDIYINDWDGAVHIDADYEVVKEVIRKAYTETNVYDFIEFTQTNGKLITINVKQINSFTPKT